MNRCLVTGANGFVGSALVKALAEEGIEVIAAVRSNADATQTIPGVTFSVVDGLGPGTHWDSVLAGVDTVVHCAARVHVMTEDEADPLEAFRAVNVEGTLRLAQQAAKAGVKRFVFLSSIKVNGEHTDGRPPFSSSDAPVPEDHYGISKYEAEEQLKAISKETALELTIVRPPLVYGPGVKGNFRKLMALADSGIPLPFGAVNNQRSLIYIGNLVDFIVFAALHKDSANEVYVVSDGEDLSTKDLLTELRLLMDRKPRLVPVPVWVFQTMASVFGKKDVVQRLFGSLQVNPEKVMRQLGWKPKYSVREGLLATLKDVRDSAGK